MERTVIEGTKFFGYVVPVEHKKGVQVEVFCPFFGQISVHRCVGCPAYVLHKDCAAHLGLPPTDWAVCRPSIIKEAQKRALKELQEFGASFRLA